MYTDRTGSLLPCGTTLNAYNFFQGATFTISWQYLSDDRMIFMPTEFRSLWSSSGGCNRPV